MISLSSQAAVKELVLCVTSDLLIEKAAKTWLRWAACLPRLRRVEVRRGHILSVCSCGTTPIVCAEARAEGEDAEAMLARLLQLLPWEEEGCT